MSRLKECLGTYATVRFCHHLQSSEYLYFCVFYISRQQSWLKLFTFN